MSPTSDRDSYAPFPQTSWSLIHDAVAERTVRRRESLNEFLLRYWKPLYAYFRSKGLATVEAQDCVQEFLWDIVRKDKLSQAPSPQASPTLRFRTWLLVCAQHFVIDHWRKSGRQRTATERWVSFEDLQSQSGTPYDPPQSTDPDQAFLRGWRVQLLEQSLAQVRKDAEALNRPEDVRLFEDYYLNRTTTRRSWQELAHQYGLHDWREAVHRAGWVQRRLAATIRRLVRSYTTSDREVDEELRELIMSDEPKPKSPLPTDQ